MGWVGLGCVGLGCIVVWCFGVLCCCAVFVPVWVGPGVFCFVLFCVVSFVVFVVFS